VIARGEVTRLLWARDDPNRAEVLLPMLYDELRRLAQNRISDEGHPVSIEATGLVHEAYLRLVGDDDVRWNGRRHFYGAAAQAMRRILVERARHKSRLKRGGDRARVDLDPDQLSAGGDHQNDQLLALDDALAVLEQTDPRRAEVVMLRYFAGLSVSDTADAVGVSPATVKNDWAFARAWLLAEMERTA